MLRKFTLALLSLLLVPLGMMAQNVTVHSGNGNMLPALKAGNTDTFFRWGGFATWKHEQLSLTMTTGDSDNNSETDTDGQLARPANDIFVSTADDKGNKYLQIGKGRKYGSMTTGMETYITFALPKGYRFTSYTITFHRIPYPTPDGVPVITSGGTVYIYSTSDPGNNAVDETSGAINFGETYNTFAWKSESNASGIYYGGIPQGNTTQHTISRTSQNSTDMDNLLYFRLTGSEIEDRAFIQLDHVEFEFTAENNYTPLIPAPNVTNQSAVDIPFTTSKMDYGQLERYDENGNVVTSGGRISYNGTIHDMNANLILYEKGSVTADQDNGFDGTVGKMVAYGSGSISQAGDYFKLDASNPKEANIEKVTINGEEKDAAIYYIETPIWAVNSASTKKNKNPIGYRITDASFECTSGNLKFPAVFKIQYLSQGHSADQNGTYGLNYYNNSLAYNWNYQTEWRIDDDGYIYVGTRYLSVTTSWGTPNGLTTTANKSNATPFKIENNQIRTKNRFGGGIFSDGDYYYIGWSESGSGSNITRYVTMTTGNQRATYNELEHAFSENIGSYTFLVFDKTGTKATAYTINGNRTIPLSGLNNDAVKIGVVSGGKAIVKGGLTLQALNPYIDRLNIVCQENEGAGGKVTQQFNATDFSVKGGAFTFYVPQNFNGNAKFTFEDLYSQYGDNTYYNASNNPENHARYFFVGSEYGDYDDNVYGRYKDYSSADYTTKIDCLQPGDSPFTFNNAATATSTTGNEYEEYPFSVAKYDGNFENFIYSSAEMDQNPAIVRTAYLFTCDETRYNIAPTTATQHVYYAFYRMDIDMKKHTYAPKLSWKKLYDNTFYSANNTDIVRDSQWGLKLTTDPVTDDQGTHSGYMTMTQLENAISNAQGIVQNIGKTPTGEISQFDINGDGQINKADLTAAGSSVEGGEDLLPPTKSNQILYVDGSDLMSIMENQTANTSGSYTTHSLGNLQETLGKNALIYLPYGSRSELNNVASNTVSEYNKTPVFQGINDIVVKDRYPFYAPYDIQVKTAKMAKYERTLTNQSLYGDDDQHLTIVLPFEIKVDAGVHTNKDGAGSSFTLATMNGTKALSKNSSEDFYADGHFTKISGDHSEANKPYVVTMQGTAGESAFKVHEPSALVKATPNNAGILTGETATGTYTYKENDVNQTVEYNFTHKGTYTGIEIGEAAKGGAVASDTTVFYFANNYFLDSKTLIKGKTLKMLPFRSYYEYPRSAKAKMARFYIVFGENDEDDTTGISAVQKNSTLAVIPGDGYITIMAKADSNVAIHTVNGMTVEKCNLRAGETRTVAVPSGIYVINGVKMVVK